MCYIYSRLVRCVYCCVACVDYSGKRSQKSKHYRGTRHYDGDRQYKTAAFVLHVGLLRRIPETVCFLNFEVLRC